MHSVSNLVKSLMGRSVVRRSQAQTVFCCVTNRSCADTPKPDASSKQVVVQGNENEDLKVRRARPADVPRVMRFVREHAGCAWPGFIPPRSNSHLVICDYVSRALAQGHSMLAEQQESTRGPARIRGVAITTAVCPWDAALLENWASCVKCNNSRKLMYFTAHCLRSPGLHDKYNVQNILQVILIVPNDKVKTAEIVQMLVKNMIQRGREVGYHLLRFDVSNTVMASALEDLNLIKEWQQCYEVIPKTRIENAEVSGDEDKKHSAEEQFIAVYTALVNENKTTA